MQLYIQVTTSMIEGGIQCNSFLIIHTVFPYIEIWQHDNDFLNLIAFNNVIFLHFNKRKKKGKTKFKQRFYSTYTILNAILISKALSFGKYRISLHSII